MEQALLHPALQENLFSWFAATGAITDAFIYFAAINICIKNNTCNVVCIFIKAGRNSIHPAHTT